MSDKFCSVCKIRGVNLCSACAGLMRRISDVHGRPTAADLTIYRDPARLARIEPYAQRAEREEDLFQEAS